MINQAGDFAGDRFQAELLAVLLETHHQVRAIDTARETGIVLNFGGCHHLAAEDHAFHQQGFEFGAGGIKTSSQPGRAATDNQYVIKGFTHYVLVLCPSVK